MSARAESLPARYRIYALARDLSTPSTPSCGGAVRGGRIRSRRTTGRAAYGRSKSWSTPPTEKHSAPVRVAQLAMPTLTRLPVAGRV